MANLENIFSAEDIEKLRTLSENCSVDDIVRIKVTKLYNPHACTCIAHVSLCTCNAEVFCVLYSRKIWRGIKFGSLAIYITTAK